MDCNEARPLLSAAIDRELSATEALRVEQHLATCSECRREAQALRALSHATRAADYFRAPDALRERILAALPAVEAVASQGDASPRNPASMSEPSRETRGQRRAHGRGSLGWAWAWNAWKTPRPARSRAATTAHGLSPASAWGVGLIAVIALAASIAHVVHLPGAIGTANTTFVDELVESHVRAQLSGHDIDVVSSDQHTVKPWFDGRLDYAPPVEDLADVGFALAGGRLDYVGHRRVAVLVYRYRKHVIDVYVMPQTDAGTVQAPAALTSDGYALTSWRAQGMLWWAVSDAEPAVLAQLHAALIARLNQRPTGALR